MEPEEALYDSLPCMLRFQFVSKGDLYFFWNIADFAISPKSPHYQKARKIMDTLIDNTLSHHNDNHFWRDIRGALLEMDGISQKRDDKTRLTTIKDVQNRLKEIPRDELIYKIRDYSREIFFCRLEKSIRYDYFENDFGSNSVINPEEITRDVTSYSERFRYNLENAMIL